MSAWPSANYTIDRSRVTLIDFPKYEISSLGRSARQALRIVLFFFPISRTGTRLCVCVYVCRGLDLRCAARVMGFSRGEIFILKIRLAREGMITHEGKRLSRKNRPTTPRCRFVSKQYCVKKPPPSTLLDARQREREAHVALRRIEHEDARKSGAYSLHRGEKSEVGPFSEKWVEKVSDCTHERARRGVPPGGRARGRGVAGDAGRLPPAVRAASSSLQKVLSHGRARNRR